MGKNILRRIGIIMLALAVTVTMVPLVPQTGEASAASVSSPRVTADKTTWDCVYFGSYPQTEIVGEASQCGTYGNSYWGSTSDYEVNSTLYSQLQNASFDANGNTTINGTKYRRIKKGDATFSGWSGDSDSYYWSDSTTYHYFRYEKIKWRVLNVNGDNALLLADKALDDQRYNEDYVNITWEKCTMRSWLNGYGSSYNTYGTDYSSDNFMDTAFTSSEQSAVYSTTLENSDNIYYGTEGGNSTTDKVFLLSESDVWSTDRAVSHGFVKANDTYAEQRRAKSSTYTKAMGTYSNTSTDCAGNCWWWLRSPGDYGSSAANVSNIGDVSRFGYFVYCSKYAVRPALHLNLKSLIWSYAGTVSSDGTENVVDPGTGTHSTGSAGITEADLFGKYNAYLWQNKTYNNMMGTVWEDLDDIIYVSDDKAFQSAKATALKNGLLDNIKAIIGGFTGKFFAEKELEEEVALDLLNAIAEDEHIAADTVKELNKGYKNIKDAYKLASYGFKTDADLKLFSGYMEGVYSQKECIQMAEAVNSAWDNIDKIFSGIGIVTNAAETTFNLLVARDASMKTMEMITGAINTDTALYRGLNRIYNKNKATGAEALVTELIKNDGFEFLGGKLASAVSGAISPVEFAYKMIGKVCELSNGGTDMDDIDKAFIAESNYMQLMEATNNVWLKINKNYKAGGNVDYSTSFRFFKEAEFKALDQCVEYANKVGTKEQKEKLNKDYNKYKEFFTIDKYLESCVANANADWSYAIQNGKASIVGVNVNSGTASINLRNPLVLEAYAGETDSCYVLIDIPEEVDGYEVDSISNSAFSNNTNVKCVNVPKNIRVIESEAFSNCTSLETIFIENGLETIGEKAFSGCTSLNDISIPVSVNKIEEEAFGGNEGISIHAAEGSAGQEYAQSNENAGYVEETPDVVSIELVNEPVKKTYKFSEEEIDTTGIKVTATYEDGKTEDVSDYVSCYFEDKKVGENSVIVSYEGVETSYKVQIEAEELAYSISYEKADGTELAEKYMGKAKAGEEISLPIAEVDGYIPVESEKKIVIGTDNDYVIYYNEKLEDLSDSEIRVKGKYEYTGDRIIPEVDVLCNGRLLVKDRDYVCEYGENIEAGDGTVTVIGIGKYMGFADASFAINPKTPVIHDIAEADVNLEYSTKTYIGSELKPEVTAYYGDTRLEAGTDYTLKYENNVNAGTAKVIITGKGDYTGTVSRSFTITKASVSSVSLSPASYTYNGYVKKPSVTVTAGDKTIASGIKASNTNVSVVSVTYASGRKSVGKYKVTVKGKGNYTGTITKYFKINPKGTSISSLTKYKRAFKVKWKKQTAKMATSRISGYQIRYSTSSSMSNAKTVTKSGYTSYYKKITGLKAKKKYYVQVRTYKTVNGTKYYSSWSSKKYVTTK